MRSHPFSPGSHSNRLPRHLASVLTFVLVTAIVGCQEDAESPAAPEDGPTHAAATAVAFMLDQVSAGGQHTCGAAADHRVYCWGSDIFGQLGDGPAGGNFQPRPVAVIGGHTFVQVSASEEHTCGVTTGGLVYCWGNNEHGQLGNGNHTGQVKPVPVKGGRHFKLVNSGVFHTCALTPASRVYCWGENSHGQLGDGTSTDRLAPVAVKSGLAFRLVVAGMLHTCGVTTADKAYCWGDNEFGKLGDASGAKVRRVPVAVAGGLSFRAVTAGNGHSCGVATDHRAYCWGLNSVGQLGDGTTTDRATPRTVAGGLSFNQAVAGGGQSCGVTVGHAAYCWGSNFAGRLGDGTTADRLTPSAVRSGLAFTGVTPGGVHTCGITTTGTVYCWGSNGSGELGNGTATGEETCTREFGQPCTTRPVQVIGAS